MEKTTSLQCEERVTSTDSHQPLSVFHCQSSPAMGNALPDSSDEASKLSLPEWHKLLMTAMQFQELNQKCKSLAKKEI